MYELYSQTLKQAANMFQGPFTSSGTVWHSVGGVQNFWNGLQVHTRAIHSFLSELGTYTSVYKGVIHGFWASWEHKHAFIKGSFIVFERAGNFNGDIHNFWNGLQTHKGTFTNSRTLWKICTKWYASFLDQGVHVYGNIHSFLVWQLRKSMYKRPFNVVKPVDTY